MNLLIQPPKVSEEEIEYYGDRYVRDRIWIKEEIIFEHYLQREIMLKHREASRNERMKKSRLQSAL